MPNQPSPARKRIVVIGGGIAGLSAAHRLGELDPTLDVTLLEASGRLGGVLDTVRRDGFLIERSADNFITNVPWAVDLCRRVGLEQELIRTSSEHRGAMVVCRGRLENVPPGFMLLAPARLGPILTTPILSPLGKLRLLAEPLVPRRKESGDETLASFARRRLGREAFERIVQPLVGGIYTADPEKLSLQATLPRFLEMERRYGGLVRGARMQSARSADETESDSGVRYGLFVTPRGGLSSLVEALAVRLPAGCIRLRTSVEKITRDAAGIWKIQIPSSDASAASLECEGLIVSVPAPLAGRLLAECDADLAADLSRIPYAGTVVVTLAYRREQINHPLNGFGFVVPAVEQRRILAASFSSVKFAGRAPEGSVLVRVFIGGACQSELADLADDALADLAQDELRALLGARGTPILTEIARWPHAMPQYHLGHCDLVARIERSVAKWPNLALAGNAYHGVGIPHCIHSGEQAAERTATALRGG